VPARKEYIKRPDDINDFGGGTPVMTPAPTICPVDDPNDSQDQCNYEDCCAWNNAWCNNSCGNIDPNDTDKVETCDEFMVLIKNACVCNTIGPEFCTDDFREQILNRDFCATGPDACEGYEYPSPTPSPSTSQSSHPCGTDSCRHTCKIFPDPNYITWSNHYYAFHGTCDQIAIDNDNIQVQIRTKRNMSALTPGGAFSALSEVGVYFKATGETFNYYYDARTNRYITLNKLSTASVKSVVHNKIIINDTNTISFSGHYSRGVTLEVLGSGGYMFGSVGMCGSWNNGHARFSNGDIFDTSGGFGQGTYRKSFALAEDWIVSTIPGLMSMNPGRKTDLLTFNSLTLYDQCFDPYYSSRRLRARPSTPKEPIHAGCQETNCDKIESVLFRKACEADIAITADTSWACADMSVDHEPILEASSSEFELTKSSIDEFNRQKPFV